MNTRQQASKSVQPRVLQRRGANAPSDVHQAAEDGLADGGGALPFADQIQHSFGAFDVSGIRAHTGGAAQKANEQMGSMAYATGNDVAFRGAPDLFTAAHEAAHVIQQRAGVQLRGGVGEAGDRYEQHADAVASRVVQGQSAEDLLAQFSGGGAAPIQQRSRVQQRGRGSHGAQTIQKRDAGQVQHSVDPVSGAIAAAAFTVQVLPNNSSGLTYQNVIGQYARNQEGRHERRRQTRTVVWLDAIKGAGASWGYFEVDFEYDGSSIQSYRTKLGHASGFAGGVLGSSGSCNFQATPRGNGTEPTVEVLVAFSGDLDPSGPGFCSYDGSFIIKADGTLTLRDCAITRGDAHATRKSFWWEIGW